MKSVQNKYLPVYSSKRKAFMLLGAVLFIYLLDNLPIGKLIDYMIYINIIKPVLWIGLAGLVWMLPRPRPKAALKLRNNLNLWAFNFAAIFIIISIIAGLIDGFGKSPYDHSIIGMIINILTVGSMLVGREAVRYYSVNNLTKEESFLVFILIASLTTLSGFTIDRFTKLKDIESIVTFVAQFVAPEFMHNLLATYLTFLGGWLPAVIYMGIIKAFHWLSPILPNLQWITAALIGIMCPAFSLSAMQSIYLKESKTLKSSEKDKEGIGGWIITSILSIGIIWFSVGVFPIYPSVVATGSMEPMIKPGDMIIAEKILKIEDANRLKVGDIIQFKRGDILISHRIIEIVEEENVKYYRTKGDNNSLPDPDLVKPEELRGKLRYVIPKIGWLNLLIKKEDNAPPEGVEF